VQPTLHQLPPQSTPLRQLDIPQLMSHDEAWLQSTPWLQELLPHSTRQGMPAGHTGVQSGVPH